MKWGAAGAAALVTIAIFSPDNNDSATSPETGVLAALAVNAEQERDSSPLAEANPAVDQETNSAPDNDTTPDVPRERCSTLGKAETYASMMHLSKQGICVQLTSFAENFTAEEAQYAVDNLAM